MNVVVRLRKLKLKLHFRGFGSQLPLPNYNITKEIQKTVDPFSSIRISSNVPVQIKPYDFVQCPDSNFFRARLWEKEENGNNGQMLIEVDGKNIKVVSDFKPTGNDLPVCTLEVPVKSDLKIEAESSVQIADMYSDYIKVDADKEIRASNLRSSIVDLGSEMGKIHCDGLILAQRIDIHSEKGDIVLDKLQGDLLHCKTFGGNISLNSCYVEKSNFVTETGSLSLRNLHKTSEIYVLEEGNVEISGIHGNIYLKSNAGDLNLQFSEIVGDNIVMANDSKNVIIDISDLIEEQSFVEISSDKISLSPTIAHLKDHLMENNIFRLGGEHQPSKLLVCTKGSLVLGKMSWSDKMKQMFGYDLKEDV